MPKKTKQFDARAISDPAHIRLLASPVRQELADTLASLGGEATVTSLAEQLGRPADGLYYHLQLLAEAGLVHEQQSTTGDRVFRLAGAAQSPLRLSYELASDDARKALSSYVRGLVQVAKSDFEAGMTLEGVGAEGKRRQLWAARNKGWVSAAELEEVNSLLERLCELVSQTRGPSRDHPMSLAFVLAPSVVRSPRRGTVKRNPG